jgi:hypothetical protein
VCVGVAALPWALARAAHEHTFRPRPSFRARFSLSPFGSRIHPPLGVAFSALAAAKLDTAADCRTGAADAGRVLDGSCVMLLETAERAVAGRLAGTAAAEEANVAEEEGPGAPRPSFSNTGSTCGRGFQMLGVAFGQQLWVASFTLTLGVQP